MIEFLLLGAGFKTGLVWKLHMIVICWTYYILVIQKVMDWFLSLFPLLSLEYSNIALETFSLKSIHKTLGFPSQQCLITTR